MSEERIFELHRELETYRDNLASLYMKRGEAERAIELLDGGLAVRPDAYMTAVDKARLLTAIGRVDEARQIYRDVLEGTPTAAALYEAYGDWLLARGERTEAVRAFRQSLVYEAQNESLRRMVRKFSS